MRQNGLVTLIVIILLVLALGIVGYLTVSNNIINQSFPVSQTIQITPQNTPVSQLDSCNVFDGSNFQSTNQHEVGLGPNGPAIGYWRIIFKKNSFQWGHSDFSETGTYTCSTNVLEAKLFNRSITANYDAGRNILIWDGVEYEKVE